MISLAMNSEGRDGFILALFIFMAVVPKRDLFPIVIRNTRLGHCRSANISGDVISDRFGELKLDLGAWT